MIKEIHIKTALSPSQLPGLDYALNPYRGCAHACVYCYAPTVIHWNEGKWNELVELMINLPRILSKELRLKKKGVVGLGTGTDPYQPAEKKWNPEQQVSVRDCAHLQSFGRAASRHGYSLVR